MTDAFAIARLASMVFVSALVSCGASEPKIESVVVAPSTITEGQYSIVVATITDEDGLDDIVGGKLTNEDGSIYYAPFEQLSKGVFEAQVIWSQLHAAKPIVFDTTETRVLRVEFIDNHQKSVESTATLTLTCGKLVACAGKCVDKMTNEEHCGACGNACPPSNRCEQGVCVPYCEPCLAEHCAMAEAMCMSQPACAQLRQCLHACTDQACADPCLSANPSGLDAYLKLHECSAASCADVCGPQP